MAQVRIPSLGESVTEGTIVRWLKDDGAVVGTDDVLLGLETDRANVEIRWEQGGGRKRRRPAGAAVQVGDVVGEIEPGGAAGKPARSAAAVAAPVAPAASAAPAPSRASRPAAAGTAGPAARH